MDINNRFARRYTTTGKLEIIILRDSNGNLLDSKLGPYSVDNPPSSVEFPDWATLKSVVQDNLVNEDKLSVSRVKIQGPSDWQPSTWVGEKPVSFSISADVSTNGSVFIDSDGNSTDINTGDVISYSSDKSVPRILDDSYILSAQSGDEFTIQYKKIIRES